MGGLGSGWQAKKTMVEASLCLSMPALLKKRALDPFHGQRLLARFRSNRPSARVTATRNGSLRSRSPALAPQPGHFGFRVAGP